MARHDDAPQLNEMLATASGEGLKDLLRDVVRDALQELIEEELTAAIGAAKHERTETRTAQRNGGRDRLVSTPAGDVEVRIPKLRQAASSRRCSSRAGGSTGHCGR
jgi:putative transposase